MKDQVVSIFRLRDRSRDWSPRELAEFYRVESVLVQGGIRLDTERGVSDEGDPWFVFCRQDDGEVIVHIARCDGYYILASSTYEEIARGFDIGSLVRDLISRQSNVRVACKQSPTSNVYLHPATLLIAAVATAFFKAAEARALELRHEDRDSAQGSGANSTFGFGIFQFIKTISPEAIQGAVAFSAIIASLLGSDSGADVEHSHASTTTSIAAAQDTQDVSTDLNSSSSLTRVELTPNADLVSKFLSDPQSGDEAVHSAPAAQDSLKFGALTLDEPSVVTHLDSKSASTTDTPADYSVLHDGGNANVQFLDLMGPAATVVATGDAHAFSTAAPVILDSLIQSGAQIAVDAKATFGFVPVGAASVADGLLSLAESTSAVSGQIHTSSGKPTISSSAEPSSTPAMSAALQGSAVAGASGPIAPPSAQSQFQSAIAPTSAQSQFQSAEMAVQGFISTVPGYVMSDNGHEVVLYDPNSLTNSHVTSVSWDFADGSSLSLIGLPANLPHLA